MAAMRSDDLARLREQALFWAKTIVHDLRGLAASRAAPAAPLTDVNLEPTNLCNANCVFCGYQFQERPHELLPVESAYAIVDAGKRAGATRLGLTPMVGEPLVHRQLDAILRYAKAPPHPLEVGLTTNAILLTPERYQTLVAAGVSQISVSMTYPDDAEYRRIYRSAKLKTVVANLEGILDLPPSDGCRMAIGVRTPRRKGWDTHPLFVRARARGWIVDNNRFFDDWSGRTSAGAEPLGLWTRPLRAKVLPCNMTYAGPHFLSDRRATACGCRDLDGKSELALPAEDLLADMRAVYTTGQVATLREAFRQGAAPDICRSCRHYNPHFGGESMGARLRQLAGDAQAAVTDLTRTVLALRRPADVTPDVTPEDEPAREPSA